MADLKPQLAAIALCAPRHRRLIHPIGLSQIARSGVIRNQEHRGSVASRLPRSALSLPRRADAVLDCGGLAPRSPSHVQTRRNYSV